MSAVTVLVGLAGLAMAMAPAPAPLAGDYASDAAELAARLQLLEDGRFRFALSYGALDEQATGRWAAADGAVRLTTEPRPVAPRFAVVSDMAAPAGELIVALDDPELLQGSSLTLAVFYEGQEMPVFVEADEAGRVALDPARRAVALVPDLPVFPVPLKPHPLSPGGHRIVFRFEANDLGVADFAGEPLSIEGDTLVLRRHDREIRFRRQPPG